jgi:hypothetical protein
MFLHNNSIVYYCQMNIINFYLFIYCLNKYASNTHYGCLFLDHCKWRHIPLRRRNMRLFYILFFVLAKSYLNQLYIQSTISVVIFLGVGIFEGQLSHLGSNSSEDMGNDNYNYNNIAAAKGLFFIISLRVWNLTINKHFVFQNKVLL